MNTRTLGDRAFVAAAPTLWNSLPVKTRLVDSIDTFKKQTDALIPIFSQMTTVYQIRLEWKTFSVIDYCIFWHLK